MARRYAITAEDTNTASTTTWGITSAATIRPRIYEINIGSDATPADNAWEFTFKRYTAAGTSTAVTPRALDPADPTSLASAGVNHSVEPTYTANSELLHIAGNQRATWRWVASPDAGIGLPPTAANGIGCFSVSATASAVNMVHTVHWEE